MEDKGMGACKALYTGSIPVAASTNSQVRGGARLVQFV
jgi:hypothetical protein